MPVAAATTPSSSAIQKRIVDLFAAATGFVVPERSEALMRKWTPRQQSDLSMPEHRLMAMMTDAAVLSADLVVSQPSASGSTPFDRLARTLGKTSPIDAAAIAALCRARFRLFRIQSSQANGDVKIRDILSDETLLIEGTNLPPMPPDVPMFGRVASTGDGCGCLLGAVTPLDAAALVAAQGHAAAGGKGGFANARWAEAVYTHVVRHGTMDVPGLNRPAADGDDSDLFEDIDAELLALASDWAALADKAPDPDLVLRARQSADLTKILDALDGAVTARTAKDDEMADAFERVLSIQLGTVLLRERGGSVGLTLDAVARTLDEAIASRGWPSSTRALFARLRPRQGNAPKTGDQPLDRLVQRIQGLRAKTVAQGCTEQEAMAAAEKVAELLDRYGLSLSELELQAQPCEGIGIQTNRRRMAPIDECIPSIAAFFDCRVWAERAQGAALRYIFFGLRGDVVAAQYLYEMIERAFDTETDNFRMSELYDEMAGDRRSATNSFQLGLSRGITAKLRMIRVSRDATIRSASGRDLVPVKSAMIEEEMAKLGLSLSRKTTNRGKRVIRDAYAAGKEAGDRFEFAHAITAAA